MFAFLAEFYFMAVGSLVADASNALTNVLPILEYLAVEHNYCY